MHTRVDAGATEAGFKRGYGSKSVFEDVATYVEMFYDDTSSFATHAVCQQFSGLTDEVPHPQLLAFAKLNFLRGLELIAEADYEACVQNVDPANEDGFTLADQKYSVGLKAGSIYLESNIAIGEEGSRWAVLGSTSTAQAMLQIFARPPYYSPSDSTGSTTRSGGSRPTRGSRTVGKTRTHLEAFAAAI